MSVRKNFPISHTDGRRHCKHCSASYKAKTGDDNLKYHMWVVHEEKAKELGIRMSRKIEKKNRETEVIGDSDDELQGSLPPRPSPPRSILPSSSSFSSPSVCSSTSSSSISSSISSSSTTTVVMSSHAHGKRVSVDDPAADLPAKRTKQQYLPTFRAGFAEADEAAMNAQVDVFLRHALSYNLAESTYLHEWVRCIRQGSGRVLSRRQLAARAHDRVQVVKEKVVKRLRASPGVSVGIDGWTNVRHDKVINLCPVAGGVAFYWDSVVMKSFSTAEDQHPAIRDALKSIISKGVKVTSIVTDNEMVNGALFRLLHRDFPFLLHLPCAAHTIQLCVKATMRLEPVKAVVEDLTTLLLTFKASKALRVNVKTIQSQLRKGLPALQIHFASDTRWNSLLTAAERQIELEACIRPFIPIARAVLDKDKRRKRKRLATPTFDDTFWSSLHSLTSFLLAYRTATDVVQSDSATLADIHHQFVLLMDKAGKLTVPHPYAGMREDVISAIKEQWQEHVHLHAVISAAFFSCNSSYSDFDSVDRNAAMDWFIQWGSTFISYYHLSSSDDLGEIGCSLSRQYLDFKSRNSSTNVFSTFDERCITVSGGKAVERKMVRDVWKFYVDVAPELTACVQALLHLTASEAAVERSFSRQGLIHTKQRNRLSDGSVQVQMLFAFNTRALDRDMEVEDEGWVDLPDEDEDDPSESRGTVLLSQYRRDEEIVAAAVEEEKAVSAEREGGREGEKEMTEEEMEQKYNEDKQEADDDDDDDEEEEEEAMEEENTRLTLDQFVKKYIAETPIVRGYKFTGTREQTLQSALIDAKLGDMASVVIKKIKEHLGSDK